MFYNMPVVSVMHDYPSQVSIVLNPTATNLQEKINTYNVLQHASCVWNA